MERNRVLNDRATEGWVGRSLHFLLSLVQPEEFQADRVGTHQRKRTRHGFLDTREVIFGLS